MICSKLNSNTKYQTSIQASCFISRPETFQRSSEVSATKDLTLPYFNDYAVKINFTGLGQHLKQVIPTCAMCEGKVYSEEEIDKIIKELLPQSGKTLQKSLTSLIEDLTQPQKSKQNLIKDKNETINKKRVKIIKSIIRTSQKYSSESCQQLLDNRKADLYLFPGKLQTRPAEEIMKYIYLPFVESVDHFKAKINGGSNSDDNYVQACLGCNNYKSAMEPEEFLSRYPEVKGNIEAWNKKYRCAQKQKN